MRQRRTVPAIRLVNGAKLNLILEGENTLKGGNMCAAIEVPEGCTLTISGNGSLTATGGEGAGIGASSLRNGSLGTIVIDGGDIKAYGGEMAAGIWRQCRGRQRYHYHQQRNCVCQGRTWKLLYGY